MKRLNIIGQNLPDPFFDNYEEEANTAHDIIELLDIAEEPYIKLVIDKGFLRKIVHSHMVFIRDIDKAVNGQNICQVK